MRVYRFWRDLGYAIGALSAGMMTDLLGAASAITVISALTFLSGALIAVVMNAHRPPAEQPGSVRRDRTERLDSQWRGSRLGMRRSKRLALTRATDNSWAWRRLPLRVAGASVETRPSWPYTRIRRRVG